MDVLARGQHHARVRALTHIKRLDDCFGDFLVRVVCECGACREIQPQALARLVGWKMTLKELALRMRCSRCGKTAGRAPHSLGPCSVVLTAWSTASVRAWTSPVPPVDPWCEILR